MDFQSSRANVPITEEAYAEAAEDLGCDVAAIKAVAEVEARAKGFLEDGRPQILFERHKFRKFTNGQFNGSHPDISGPAGGYKGGAREYDRLAVAIRLDRDAALKSASWGKFQIMGFNHEVCGFADVEDFVAAMVESEDRHLQAFVAFVVGNRLDRHLRSLDWARFALGYNGPQYRKNAYHTKMAKAYEKYASEPRPTLTTPRPGWQTDQPFQVQSVRDLQKALDYLGISPGNIDNIIGPKTQAAIKTFERFARLPETGEFSVQVRAAVQASYYMMRKFDEFS